MTSDGRTETTTTADGRIVKLRYDSDGKLLGVIPNRMPSVGYDMSGYRYVDIDPLTGVEKHPGLRFDTSGKPYNAEPGSPKSYRSIIEGMVYSALSRGAIAPLWEVRTARMQTDASDPKAGLTEEERAGRELFANGRVASLYLRLDYRAPAGNDPCWKMTA